MGRNFDKNSVDEISSCGVDCISTRIEEIDDAVCSYLDGGLKGSTITVPMQKNTTHVPKGLIPDRVIGREEVIEKMAHSSISVLMGRRNRKKTAGPALRRAF